MSKKTRGGRITRNTGRFWGWICIIPFGWIFFMASLICRKNDVIKYKSLEAGVALDVLRNYIQSFICVCIFVAVLCLISYISSSGFYLLPGLGYIVSIIVIPITYNIVTDKILSFEEKRQSDKKNDVEKVKQNDASTKSKKKITEQENDNGEDDNAKRQLKELKEQNRRQFEILEKLEKEIKKENNAE